MNQANTVTANTSQMTLQSGAQIYPVLSISGHQAIFGWYDFILQLANDVALVGQSAQLTFCAEQGNTQQVDGVIVEQSITDAFGQQVSQLRLVSRLQQLNEQRWAKLYVNQSVVMIAKQIFESVGYSRLQIIERLLQSYPIKVHIVQTTVETAWQFVERILAEVGIFLVTYYDDELKKEVLLLVDENLAVAKAATLTYVAQNNVVADPTIARVYDMQPELQQTTHQLQVQGRHENYPQQGLQSQSQLTGKPRTNISKTHFGESLKDRKESAQIAKIHAKAEQAEKQQIIIKSNVATLAAGTRIDLIADDFGPKYSAQYIVTQVAHYLDQTNLLTEHGKNISYHNQATLIPVTQAYRKAIPARPSLPLCFTAKLESQNDYPDLSDQGKQAVVPNFIDAKASQPVHRMQSMTGPSGPSHGVHFPIANEAEVLLSYLNGNTEDLIILGALHNGVHYNPVTASNANDNILRTFAGNLLKLKDDVTAQLISLQTPDGDNQLKLNYTEQHVNLSSYQGTINFLAGKALKITSGTDTHETHGGQRVQNIKNSQQVQVKQAMQFNAANDLYLTSLQGMVQQAEENIEMQSGNNFLLNCQQQTLLNAQQGDINCAVQSGHAFISAKQALTITGQGKGDMHFSNGDNGFCLKSDGSIDIYGKNLLLNATEQINLLGKVNYQAKQAPPEMPTMPGLDTPEEIVLKAFFDLEAERCDWLKVRYSNVNQPLPMPQQFSLQISNADRPNETESRGGQLNDQAVGSIVVDNSASLQQLKFKAGEVVAINGQAVNYPHSQVPITNTDFNPASVQELPELAPATKADKVAKIDINFPMVVLDLIHLKNKKAALTPEQIAYFKNNGNNVTIFIHGFNIPFGELPQQFKSIKPQPVGFPMVDPNPSYWADAQYEFLDARRTLYRNAEMVSQHLQLKDFKPEALYNDEVLNGTGAHNWFLYMEDNLNRATGQFDRSDYTKFTRLLHVAWNGGDEPWEFLAAEKSADNAGIILARFIEILHDNGITINIIAHSLGNRVLLRCMDKLGKYPGNADMIDQVFLCEAAVTCTALSELGEKDTTVNSKSKFTFAYKAAKKIHVCYSDRDHVLSFWFWFAEHFEISPYDFMAGESKEVIQKNFSEETWPHFEKVSELLAHPDAKNLLFYSDDSELCSKLYLSIDDLTRVVQKSHKIIPALGYTGPDTTDPFITSLINEGKLILHNTSKFIPSHSAMKEATGEIIEELYKKIILDKKSGITQFGKYT